MPKSLSASQLLVALVLLAALSLAAFPPPGLERNQAAILGIVLLTLSLWATQILANYLPTIIFFAAMLVFGLAPPDLVFSGFASAAVWLVVSGFVIGSAIKLSGLGDRLASIVAPGLTTSYPRLIGGLFLLAMMLGFLMPSSVGRAVALMPVGLALANRCGFAPGSNGRIGIAVALAIGCNMPSFAILPSNIPNMVLAGAAETIHGLRFGYLDYLLLHYPILGIVKGLITVALVLKLFPATIAPAARQDGENGLGETMPTARKHERSVAAILLLTLAFWATDSLHGVNPAWIGLTAAAVLLLPRIGIVDPQTFKAAADFGTVLFVAGALALGAAINASGLGLLAGQWLGVLLPLQPGHDFLNFLSLSAMSIATGLFATVPTVPAVLTPLAQNMAEASGLSLDTVLMTQVVGFSTIFFPYQVAPLVVAMQLSGEKLRHVVRITIPLALITIVALIPLDYLWWAALGWL
ncbi:MAG: SLC13 family permease [Allorhizobium sp.]